MFLLPPHEKQHSWQCCECCLLELPDGPAYWRSILLLAYLLGRRAAIFDANGNLVIGGQKVLDLKLEDATYETLMRAGLIVKASFDLKPGKYLVRQVVRDSEGSQMAARNGTVVIPQ